MSNVLKILMGLLLVFSILFYAFQAEGTQKVFQAKGTQKSHDNWEKMLRDYPIPKDSIELELRFSFPKKELEKKGIFLISPRCVQRDSEGNIYVTDDRLHKVLKFDSSGNYLFQFGQRGQGPGDFMTPHKFFITKEDILIIGETGNMRFQFFDKNGKYIKSFKIFKGYNSWIVGNNGLIFALPVIRKASDHLIEVLNQDGVVISSFGEPFDFKYKIPTYNDAKIEINHKGELYVAFKFLPTVRKYSQNGELLANFIINHSIMKEYGDYNRKNQSLLAKGKKVKYKPVINSIKLSETGFYLMRHFPRIEILEFDNKGKRIAQYWREVIPYLAEYFVVRNDIKEKIFYVLYYYPEVKIDAFGQKDNLIKKGGD